MTTSPVTDTPRRELPTDTSQMVFHTLMEALSRPGTIGQLPVTAPEQDPHGAALLPLLGLSDIMTTLSVVDAQATVNDPDPAATAQQLIEQVSRVTSAKIVDPQHARFALAIGEATNFETLNVGSHWSPETGAMLIQQVPDICLDPAHPSATAWRLSGPGIPADSNRMLDCYGLSAAWLQTRNALCDNYPAGVDCLLVTQDGRVTGLPRTTRIQEA